MSLLCFHITTEQSSQYASPVPPNHTIFSQRKSFHSKLCTLPESTSLISIRYSEKHQCSNVVCSLSLSLSWILLQQSLGQVLGAAESSSLAPSSPTANRTSPHSVLPTFLTSTSSCLPSSWLCSTLFYYVLLIFFHATKNLRWLPPEAFWKSSTPFHPSPTACRHCLLLLINSAPYLPIISSRQFSWTTQHTPADTMQAMQLHVVVNGAPQ